MADFLGFLGAHQARSDRGIRFGGADSPQLSYHHLWQRAAGPWPVLDECSSGQVVLIVSDNSPAQCMALLACWSRGLVPCCVAPPARLSPGMVYAQSLEGWVRASGAAAGLCDEELLPRFQGHSLPLGWSSLQAVSEHSASSQGRVAQGFRGRPHDRVYLQFSSGTTAAPRPVWLTAANVMHNVDAILQACALRGPLQQHSCVSWLPLYHDMGLVGSFLSALAAQGNLLLMKPYQFAARPHSWLSALSATQATISPAPNFALAACLERVNDQQLQGLDLSHWQLALLGSETIFPQTVRAFYEKLGPYGLRWESLTPVYGLAEATLAVTFSPPGQGPRFMEFAGRELVSLGPPLPGIEVAIEEGKVLTRSPSATCPAGQWLDTGDLGFLDQGELFLTGRAKDILIVRGRNYAAQEIEDCLADVPPLDPSRSAAIAARDESVIVVAEMPRKTALDPGLVDQARAAVARRTGLVVEVRLVEAGWLPRTTSGKVRRASVLEQLESVHEE